MGCCDMEACLVQVSMSLFIAASWYHLCDGSQHEDLKVVFVFNLSYPATKAEIYLFFPPGDPANSDG